MTEQVFTPTEAAALLELPERLIRKEIEHGLVDAGTPPRLEFSVLVYLEAVRLMQMELAVSDRRRVLTAVRNALVHGRDRAELSTVLFLELRPAIVELTERLEAFERWKAKLVTDNDILGGEPVFPKSRLSVRHIGAIAARGESNVSILEDYPYLTAEDVRFATTYARAYPRVGRPSERQAPPR